ncbi:MAG: N-acetylmuramic acid 6-phosphate etherase, partial [Verrucomicrobiales bacterium]
DEKPTGVILGIEGGGTRTTVLLVGEGDTVLASIQTGPANLRLMDIGELVVHLQAIREELPMQPCRVGIGLAGVRLAQDHQRLRSAVAAVWPGVPCATSDDLVTALEAAEKDPSCAVQVLVLSGTGSCVTGRRLNGESTKLGGRGHILGDRASACDIAQDALRSVMERYDLENAWPALGADILTFLQMNEPEDLIDWSLIAKKNALASVAVPVFHAAVLRDDVIAKEVLARAASRLCEDARAGANRLLRTGERVQFIFNGAVLLKNPEFQRQVAERLEYLFPEAVVTPLAKPSAWGAIALARSSATKSAIRIAEVEPTSTPVGMDWRPVTSAPTEQRHPLSAELSDMSVTEGVDLMITADQSISRVIVEESAAIAWTIDRVVRAFAEGGRLIYTGAGTSGRLGVLDASECPPTFSVSYDQVQGIIAGGRTALWSAVEGAEDDHGCGRRAIASRHVTAQDVVVGISASAYAPFMWGSLQEAKERGATTVLLCCNPAYKDHPLPDQVIAPNTGPEILTGSTRLKAGTATKLILNMITTLAMTHSGKVLSNHMIDLNPSNAKLRKRALRIVGDITGADEEGAQRALEASGWIVRDACRSFEI